ncbi:Heavy metal tolerance protein [Paramyrothecium foliicola]|nr:Heavy metal tolerance protein [Paramyrothecium foliicola]
MVASDEIPPDRRNETDAHDSVADLVLRNTEYIYSLVLLVTFISCAAWYSIVNAKKEEDVIQSQVKGPGGKPLPLTKRKKRDDGERKIGPHFGPTAKNVFRTLAAGVFLTYVATGMAMLTHAFRYEDPFVWSKQGLSWAGEWTVVCCDSMAICPIVLWKAANLGFASTKVHVLGAVFFYLYILFSLFDWRKGPNIVHLIVWALALVGELVLFTTTLLAAFDCQNGAVQNSEPPKESGCNNGWVRTDLVLYFLRILLLLGLIGLYCAAWVRKVNRKTDRKAEEGRSSESTPLLNGYHRSYDSSIGPELNGRRTRGRSISNAAKAAGVGCARKDEQAAFYRPQKLPHKTWWEYLRGYSLFFPYLWPKDAVILQMHVHICFMLVMLQRMVNLAVPWQIGNTVRAIETVVKELNDDPAKKFTLDMFPSRDVLLLGVLWILQGQSGLLGCLRSLLWIPVSQHSYRGLTTAAFNHVHSLSLDFHLSKRTGEVLSALNKGSAINSFLEQVTFQVFPMLIDLFVSITFFYVKYGPIYAQINLVDTCWYLYMTIKMASTRADQRREMTNADREEEAVKNDSISSYETVKYFNAEEFESRRYQDKVGTFQKAEAKVQIGMVLMNICQTIVYNLGRLLATAVCGWQVIAGTRNAGDLFTVISYLTQLQGPLNFFGTFYRTVQQAMISGERLLELFKIQPSVVDAPHAVPLRNFRGHIRWNNVSFAYDPRKPALRNISFECAPGTTTAFVGESGGGKSTLFRHMFRYYDCDEGSIELDGKNVKDLTISSVRRHIGVVPQDTTLFNETLMYNLKYANPDATDEEVYAACRAASIHDRIMSFPDQYQTQVGERGLRLSGGEKQRVAIARTILKDPRIIMLDEATSALDSHTEQEIQDNVWNIGQGRTLLIIAYVFCPCFLTECTTNLMSTRHRLSTITHADQIIVLNAGMVVERGTHDELLQARGRYASMWEKQIRAERALDAAREAHLKAARALRRANMGGKKQPDDPLEGYNSLKSPGPLSGSLGAHKASVNGEVEGESTSSSSSTAGSSASSDAESTHG